MNPPVRAKVEDSTPELLPCPGKRLREAREAKKMKVETAADQLHLSRATIEALEAEDFDKLPARVFVRGYYRNYARLVGVSEETINREFNERCPDGECTGAPPPVKNVRSEMRSSHGLVQIITWSLIGMMVVVLAWWAKNNILWPESTEKPGDPVIENRDGLSTGEEMPVASGLIGEQLIPPQADSASTAAPESVVEPPPAGKSNFATQEPAEDVPASVLAEQAAPVVEPTAVEKIKAKSEIKIEFNGDCWVDIRDQSRQFKLVGIMRAGDSRKLGGKAPFSIVLGDYTVVNLTIDGKPYDLSAHGQGKTAKFTLDPVAVAAN